MTEHSCTEKETLKEISYSIANIAISQAKSDERIIALDKRINGSYKTFHDHITQGRGWRVGIVSLIVTVVLQFIGFAFLFGNIVKNDAVQDRIIQREILDGEMHNRSVQ